MNEIDAWLQKADSNYKQGLELLRKHCRNKYLLRSLSLKESRYNRAKLTRELKKIAPNNIPLKLPAKQPVAPAPEPLAEIVPDQETVPVYDLAGIDLNNMTPEQTAAAVEKLEVALGKMHNKKGILANSLRNVDVKDNEGRKAILSQIDGLNADMNEIRGKLDYHQKNGKLPPVAPVKTKKDITIPDDPVKMKEMLLNLRSSRTKINKRLKDKSTPAGDIEKLTKRLAEKVSLIVEIEGGCNMAEEQNSDFINAVLEDWSNMTMNQLKRSVQDAGLELTEDLYNSLRVEVARATAEDVAKADFYFRMHGRWKDMRTVYRNYTNSWRQSGFPPVKVIEDFIKKVGLEKFRYIPGYKMGTVPTESVAIRRLAWGIAIGIGKRNTMKAKKWYAKTFYRQIEPLMEQLGAVMREQTAKRIKEGFENE